MWAGGGTGGPGRDLEPEQGSEGSLAQPETHPPWTWSRSLVGRAGCSCWGGGTGHNRACWEHWTGGAEGVLTSAATVLHSRALAELPSICACFLVTRVGAMVSDPAKPRKPVPASSKDVNCPRKRGLMPEASGTTEVCQTLPGIDPLGLATLLLLFLPPSNLYLDASTSRKPTLITLHPGLARGSTPRSRPLSANPGFATP